MLVVFHADQSVFHNRYLGDDATLLHSVTARVLRDYPVLFATLYFLCIQYCNFSVGTCYSAEINIKQGLMSIFFSVHCPVL